MCNSNWTVTEEIYWYMVNDSFCCFIIIIINAATRGHKGRLPFGHRLAVSSVQNERENIIGRVGARVIANKLPHRLQNSSKSQALSLTSLNFGGI